MNQVKFGVSGHSPKNAWRKWPEILQADVPWPPLELISLWPGSDDLSYFGTILTYWNGSNLGFPGISWRTHGGNGLKFCMLVYLDHLQNLLVHGHSLLIFSNFGTIWFSEMGQIWGFRAFPGKNAWREGLNYDMLLYHDHLQNWLDYSYSLLIFLILMLFWLSETGQIWGFQAFRSCSVEFPHNDDPLAEIGHIGGFWALSGERVGVNVEGGGGIFPTLCVEFCLVFIC